MDSADKAQGYPEDTVRKKLLIAVETLLPGGAELFSIRMANAMTIHFDVILIVLHGDLMSKSLTGQLKPEVRLIGMTFPGDFLIKKLDRFLFLLKIDFSLRSLLVRNRIRRLVTKEKIFLVHSNQFKVDHVFQMACQGMSVRHVSTIHGDYLNFYLLGNQGDVKVLNFERKAREVLFRLDGIAYLSDRQMKFFTETWKLSKIQQKAVKIYNGTEMISSGIPPANFVRKGFVFGMVARGIPEKGWRVAIEAFLMLNRADTQLVLVGQSDYLSQLSKEFNQPDICFYGYAYNPADIISQFDVGLLPSTFPSESLPTSVIEYLMLGKPVIASDVGEVRNMLIRNGESAGVVLPVVDGVVNKIDLCEGMRMLAVDHELYAKCQTHARSHAKVFNMTDCIDAYLSLYRA